MPVSPLVVRDAAPGHRTCTHAFHTAPDGFPACRGDLECSGTTVACGQGSIACPRHGSSPAFAVARVRATDVAVGEMITELDTPSGPWYAVLEVVADGFTVEGGEPGDAESLPVPLEVGSRDYVLVRRLPIADAASDSARVAIDPLEVTVSPSGRFGFYRPGKVAAWESEPVVAVAQAIAVGSGLEWHPTPARYYESTVLGMNADVPLAIDAGAGWSLEARDVAGLKRFTFGRVRPIVEPRVVAVPPVDLLALADGLSRVIANDAGDPLIDVSVLDAAYRSLVALDAARNA